MGEWEPTGRPGRWMQIFIPRQACFTQLGQCILVCSCTDLCTYMVIPLLDQHQFPWTLISLPFRVCGVVHGSNHHGIPNSA